MLNATLAASAPPGIRPVDDADPMSERRAAGNLLRVQADSTDQAFDVNDGAKLDLGSTAKLRTLVTYLEIVAEFHDRFGRLDRAALHWVRVSPRDELGRWALDYLTRTDDRRLSAILDAALDRRYSASPREAFFTGGGVHYFGNFHRHDDDRIVTVREAFSESINLPFVRLMRDIVQHLMFGLDASGWLPEPVPAQRDEYLARFAAREGETFLRRFCRKYRGRDPDAMIELLASSVKRVPGRQAAAFLAVAPDANVEGLGDHLTRHLPRGAPFDVNALYLRYASERYSLDDRGTLAHIHPLELWLVKYLRRRPDATVSDVLAASTRARQESYRWLFHTSDVQAQEIRIGTVREEDAFAKIAESWRRLGYPFDSLVPSYATAIGSSADRPAALVELMGIIANDGMRMPVLKIGALHFASDTPFESRLVPALSRPQRVLAPEIAATVRTALRSVVERGTARRLAVPLTLADGSKAAFAGKTGTGDSRVEVFGPGGRVVSSRAASRAGTFVFMLGDRYFGTISAYVSGAAAQQYEFTSALPLQVLNVLAPVLARHLGNACVFQAEGKILVRKNSSPPGTQRVAAVDARQTVPRR